MIEIICDQYGLHKSTDSEIVVSEPTQFEEALKTIKSCCTAEKALIIVVRNPALFDWFDAASKYNAKKIILDPVNLLSQQLGVPSLPEYLNKNPTWIVEYRLLEKQIPIGKGETVEAWLQRVVLGEVWTKPVLETAKDFSELLAYFLSGKKGDLHPLEKKLIANKLTSWVQNANQNTRDFLTWLKKDPFQRARYLIWEQLLRLFPDDQVAKWLQQGNIWFELSQFPGRQTLPRLSCTVQLPKKISILVINFLKEKWQSSPDDALQYISGEFDFEKHFLVEQLQNDLQNETPLTKDAYKKIAEFKFLDVIPLAKQLVLASEPTPLNEDSSVKEIQDWLADYYLPFYNSTSLLGKVDLTVPYVELFEKWLLSHYTEMLFSDALAYKQLQKAQKLVESDQTILIIVFDGLDYFCAYEELLPILQENNLFPTGPLVPFFAFLPTQTSIAKPVLVGGKMKSQIPTEENSASFYKKLLQENLSLSDNEIQSGTDRDSSLLELIQKRAKVYLYLDNYLDRELIHANIREYLRRKKYSEYIKKKGIEIIECINEYKNLYGTTLNIIITSDHGYTIIPINSEVIKIANVKKCKTRTVVEYDRRNLLKPRHDESVWELNPKLFGLDLNTGISKGYCCFNKRPRGATHGGCTPQEIAVPCFFFSDKEKTKPLNPLTFMLDGEIYRKRLSNKLQLTVVNPNDYEVLLLDFDIEKLKLLSELPNRLKPNASVKLSCDFNAMEIQTKNVVFSVCYRIKGPVGEIENRETLCLPTTGAMTTEFDDDFEL